MSRDPLTERYVHELREIDPDPKGWIEGPTPDERPLWARRPWNRWDDLVALLLVLASAAVVVALGRWLWRLLARWLS